jgi:3-deoxy-manno-octulosonate cytidylyltransferase (CMP-KDO synthetase)
MEGIQRLQESNDLRAYVVIPARYGSTRLPRKMLLRETGKTLLEHTWMAAMRARRPLGVVVATDDQRIFEEVQSFGGQAVMTSAACASGTDRVAEVARRLLTNADILVNVQGDEPEMDPAAIDHVIGLLEQDGAGHMATVAAPLRSREAWQDPACVKVVVDDRGRAIYFSRSPIPHVREWDDAVLRAQPPLLLQHMGLYAYHRGFLLKLAATPPCSLEQVEKLEQLRVLAMGETIRVGVVAHASAGIDTPQDYAAFVARHRRQAA